MFFIIFKFSFKLPAGLPVCRPKIDQNPQQQKFDDLQQSTFSLERCRNSRFRPSHAAWGSFFFVIPMQRGNAKNAFVDTSPARIRFFFIFSTPPQREAQKSSKCCCITVASASRFQESFIFPMNSNDSKLSLPS